MNKPSIPKGTRDFLPAQMARRNHIFDTIKAGFKKYGFLPIETPAMEKLSTLTGKYGEEGDQLIFKILNRGEKLGSSIRNIPANWTSQGQIEHLLCEQALRYDLTVPFARFVVQHQNDIAFPFKRYQIQTVWRADRPQKGRYREFYQCDADIIGTDSLLCEIELIQLMDEVLDNLGINDFTIKMNNRKVLSGIVEITGESDKIVEIMVAIDKLDKIGESGVIKELGDRGVSNEAVEKIKPLFGIVGSNEELLAKMRIMLVDSPIGLKGLEELTFVIDQINKLSLVKAKLSIDLTLARGLNYYTGAIFEVKANGVDIGSICGGGRYDDLTGIFGLKDLSGVGVSFGADRIYDVLNELDLFGAAVEETTQVLFINFGNSEAMHCLGLLKELRAAGINAELYPTDSKLKKQMNYAHLKGVRFVVMVGTNEIESGIIRVKDMATGDQRDTSIQALINMLNK
ncbi:MAG: histidine--tRNA ligase [Flavobacteriales bacterium]|nr:histidine--tRNA ligase [Flavobacteriales bacterium]